MDNATGEHLSMFFVPEEGSASSFRGIAEVIARRGLLALLYTDRGTRYWFSPKG
jgi:hypothetical protein